MDQRNASVDVFRFIAACLVFISHSIYADHLPLLVALGIIGRWTLPFFFLVSGYYFQKSYANKGKAAFVKTWLALLSVTLFVNLLYLLFVLLTEESLLPLATHFTLLTGTYFHLWFLTSMIVGYFVLWLLLVCKLESLIPYVIVVSLVVVLLLTPYNSLVGFKPHPLYARSFLSVPFICIGFYFAKHTIEINVSQLTSCWLLVTGVLVQLGEGWFLSSQGQDSSRVNFLGGTLIVSVGVFLLSLQLVLPSNSWLAHYGRRYSFPLYLYHPIVNFFLHRVLDDIRVGQFIYWISPILALAVTLGLFICLDKFVPTLFGILSGSFRRPKQPDTFVKS